MLKQLIGPLTKNIFGLVDKLHLSKQEKMEFKARAQSLVLEHEKEVGKTIRAKEEATSNIIMAEVKQDDKYTKRARPTVIYVGIILIIWSYIITPILNEYLDMDIVNEIPDFFWYSWSGIVAVYAGGRSYEKSNKKGNASGTSERVG